MNGGGRNCREKNQSQTTRKEWEGCRERRRCGQGWRLTEVEGDERRDGMDEVEEI